MSKRHKRYIINCMRFNVSAITRGNKSKTFHKIINLLRQDQRNGKKKFKNEKILPFFLAIFSLYFSTSLLHLNIFKCNTMLNVFLLFIFFFVKIFFCYPLSENLWSQMPLAFVRNKLFEMILKLCKFTYSITELLLKVWSSRE